MADGAPAAGAAGPSPSQLSSFFNALGATSANQITDQQVNVSEQKELSDLANTSQGDLAADISDDLEFYAPFQGTRGPKRLDYKKQTNSMTSIVQAKEAGWDITWLINSSMWSDADKTYLVADISFPSPVSDNFSQAAARRLYFKRNNFPFCLFSKMRVKSGTQNITIYDMDYESQINGKIMNLGVNGKVTDERWWQLWYPSDAYKSAKYDDFLVEWVGKDETQKMEIRIPLSKIIQSFRNFDKWVVLPGTQFEIQIKLLKPQCGFRLTTEITPSLYVDKTPELADKSDNKFWSTAPIFSDIWKDLDTRLSRTTVPSTSWKAWPTGSMNGKQIPEIYATMSANFRNATSFTVTRNTVQSKLFETDASVMTIFSADVLGSGGVELDHFTFFNKSYKLENSTFPMRMQIQLINNTSPVPNFCLVGITTNQLNFNVQDTPLPTGTSTADLNNAMFDWNEINEWVSWKGDLKRSLDKGIEISEMTFTHVSNARTSQEGWILEEDPDMMGPYDQANSLCYAFQSGVFNLLDKAKFQANPFFTVTGGYGETEAVWSKRRLQTGSLQMLLNYKRKTGTLNTDPDLYVSIIGIRRFELTIMNNMKMSVISKELTTVTR